MLALRKFETQELHVTFNVRTMATESMSIPEGICEPSKLQGM